MRRYLFPSLCCLSQVGREINRQQYTSAAVTSIACGTCTARKVMYNDERTAFTDWIYMCPIEALVKRNRNCRNGFVVYHTLNLIPLRLLMLAAESRLNHNRSESLCVFRDWYPRDRRDSIIQSFRFSILLLFVIKLRSSSLVQMASRSDVGFLTTAGTSTSQQRRTNDSVLP